MIPPTQQTQRAGYERNLPKARTHRLTSAPAGVGGVSPSGWRTSVATGLLLAVGSLVLFGYGFSRRALWSTHEGRAAQHAQMMLDTGQWGLPRLYWGEPDLQKPPLYYWLVAATAARRGGHVDESAVRLPSLVSAVLLVLLVYALGSLWWGPSAGLLAAMCLATMPRFFWLARVGRIDMPLALWVAAALACFWTAQRRTPAVEFLGRGKSRLPPGWLVAGYAATAVGVLFKGPVAVVLVAVPLLCFVALEVKMAARAEPSGPDGPAASKFAVLASATWGLLRRFRPIWGLFVVFGIAAPWFVWANRATKGELYRRFFLYHNWQRALGGAEELEGRPLWYYLPTLVVDAFPWSLFGVIAAWSVWRQRRGGFRQALTVDLAQPAVQPDPPASVQLPVPGTPAKDAAARFAVCWVVGMVAFLSLVRFKRADYLVPAYAGMALLLGRWASQLRGQVSAQGDRRSKAVPIAASLAILVALIETAVVLAVLPVVNRERDVRPFAALLRRHVPPGQAIAYHRMEAHDLVFYAGPPARVVVASRDLRTLLESPQPVYVVLREVCAGGCKGACIGGCLRRRRQEWPELPWTVLATNAAQGDGAERLALVTNQPRKAPSHPD